MKLIPASEVSSDHLSEFFGRIPDGEQAFLKENIRDPETAAAWRRPGPARRKAAIDEAGTLVGVMSVIPELGWSDHVGQLRHHRARPGSCRSGLVSASGRSQLPTSAASRIRPSDQAVRPGLGWADRAVLAALASLVAWIFDVLVDAAFPLGALMCLANRTFPRSAFWCDPCAGSSALRSLDRAGLCLVGDRAEDPA